MAGGITRRRGPLTRLLPRGALTARPGVRRGGLLRPVLEVLGLGDAIRLGAVLT